MNIKIKLLIGVTAIGIISGAAFGYFNHNGLNKSLNSIASQNKVLRDQAVLAEFSDEDMSSMASDIIKGKVLNISNSKWNTPNGEQPPKINFEDMQYKEDLLSWIKYIKVA